jgi:enoyl-CoA hydratase/carnithine racemase
VSEHIKTDQSKGVLTLILARPDKKNALTDDMYSALADALEASDHAPETRVVLIRAEGDMFTAGNDLGEFAAARSGAARPRNVGRFLQAIAGAVKPLVAAVQGRAVGVGTTMLLHCDQVLLAEDAKLSTPFVNLALVPEAGSSLLLPARIGHPRAFAMFGLGEGVCASEALNWGLANKVVPLEDLATESLSLARRLAKQPSAALVATKALMKDPAAIQRQMEMERIEFSSRLASPEAQEAFAAFAERRAPNFSAVRRNA